MRAVHGRSKNRRRAGEAAGAPSLPRRSRGPLRARVAALACLVLALCLGGPAGAAAPAKGRPDGHALWTPGALDPSRGQVGRWRRQLDARKRRLARARRGDPAALLALLGAFEGLAGEVPATLLRGWFERAARDRRLDPLVRAYASTLLARMHEREGDAKGAMALLEGQGVLLRWQYVGPFDNAGGSGLDEAHGPRTEPFDPAQTFAGAVPGEPLAWRVYDYLGVPDGGYISFDEYVQPNEKVLAYATTWVHVPRAQAVTFHLGTGGAHRLWVAGELVGKSDAYRSPHPLQEAYVAHLDAGWNRVLLAVATTDELWGFHLRVSDPRGAPVPGLRSQAEPAGGKIAPVRDGATSGMRRGRSVRSVLEARWQASRRPADGLALAELYWRIHPFGEQDSTPVDLIREVEPKLTTWRASWLRALLEPDAAQSRLALERAVDRGRAEKIGARLAPLLLELGWRDESLGLDRRARAFFDEARAVAPDDVVAELVAIERLEQAGFEQEALDWTTDLAARDPASQTVRSIWVERLVALGREQEALKVLTAKGRPLAGPELSRAIALYMQAGKIERALDLGRRALDAAPARPSAHARMARLLEARGDRDGARQAWARAVALAPLDPDLHASAARAALRAGDGAAAKALLRRSLVLRPQQPELRDLLAALDGTRGSDLFARHGLDLEKIGAVRTPKAWRGKGAGLLHHRVAVQVHPNGLTERLDHRIIRVVDDRGAREQAVQSVQFDPAESFVEVRRARVRRADGTIETLGRTRVVSIAQAGYRMFYDQRRMEVVFAGLRPGDTVEVAFLVRDVAARNMFDTYFGDLVPIQGLEPRAKVEYLLEAPADKPIYFNVPVERKEEGASVRYRFFAADVPGIEPEPNMPGWTDVARYLHASTYASWDDVARWYWDLVRDQLVVDDRIRGAVAQAVAGIPATQRRARAEAIYTYVVRNTRYVGLEFGIHGYKPYRTTEVFARQFGDCKDKASLLKVMLAEVGIEAELVLLRTRDLGAVATEPASLAVFNHAIVYVPEFDLYLDGTAEWAGPKELPGGDQGAVVLHVRDGKGGTFRRVPFDPPDRNVTTWRGAVELSPAGEATLTVDQEIRGVEAASLRYVLQSKETLRERVTAILAGRFGNVDVQQVQAPGIDDIRRPARLKVRARVPGFARREAKGLSFATLGTESSMARQWAPQTRRRHALVLSVPSRTVIEMEYRAPPGYRFVRAPRPGKVKGEAGRFELRVDLSQDGTRARVRSELEFREPQVLPQRYPEFRRFLRQADELLDQHFDLERAR